MIHTFRRTLLRRAAALAILASSGAARAFNRNYDESASREQPYKLAIDAHQLLCGLRAAELAAFLNDWPLPARQRSVLPDSVGVERWLPQVRDTAPPFSSKFVNALVAAAALLSWRRSYTSAQVSGEFLDNYGWTELVGLTGAMPSERLACGVLLLGPHVSYPAHRHEAEEIYVPLAGTAAWKRGNDEWHDQPPGAVIHHARFEPHAMRTGAAPLLALYLWRSENLAQKSRIDPAGPA
jgi:Dimethlysulfonioproprionate lyase